MKSFLFFLYLLFVSVIGFGQNGPRLIGMTYNVGGQNNGTIYQYTAGATQISKIDTILPNALNAPCATLNQGTNGKYYSLLNYSSGNGPFIIEYDYPTNTHRLVGTIPEMYNSSGWPTAVGNYPHGTLISAKDGKLYGLASESYYWNSYYGTADGGGMLFSYNFRDSTTTGLALLPYPAIPMGSLIQAQDSSLYGLTSHDGINSGGTIFRYNIDSSSYTTLYSLPDSAMPWGELLEIGTDTFYGMTQFDGLNRSGTIFRYAANSAQYTVLQNLPTGAKPTGSLIKASNGLLYGLTKSDGAMNYGTLFCYDLLSNVYTVLFDSVGGTGSLYQASDNNLYGVNTGDYYRHYIDDYIFKYNISTSTYTREIPSQGTVGMLGHLTECHPAILREPINTYTCDGSMVSLYAVDSTVTAPIQWQISVDSGSTYNNISGANDTMYTFTAHRSQSGDLYRAIFSHSSYSDTSVSTNLHVWPLDTVTAYHYTICYDRYVSLWGRIFNTTGIYMDTIHGGSIHGCDSISLLNLTVLPAEVSTVTTSICFGQSYTVGSYTHTISGNYIDTLRYSGINGCDSFVTLHLNVYPAPTGTFTAYTCPGQTYSYNNQVYNSPGTYIDTLTAVSINACDSFVTLHLIAYPVAIDTITTAICYGQSYSFGGQSYNTSGIYMDTLRGASVHGCDSITILNLTISPAAASSSSVSLCQGRAYQLGNHIYGSSGTYRDTVASSVFGCDSVVTVHLTFYPLATNTITTSICYGQSYTVGSYVHSSTGTYVDTLTGVSTNGCDSIVTLHLTVNSLATNTISTTICPSQSYAIAGHTYTGAGIYIDTIQGASMQNCDSIVTLYLAIYPAATNTISASVCSGQSYTVGSHAYTAYGTYTDTLSGIAIHGCDSIVTLHLAIDTATIKDISATLCAGQSLHFGNQILNAPGVFLDTVYSNHGCDSLITVLHLSTDTVTAYFTLQPSSIPYHWYAVNESYGSGTLSYIWNWGDSTTDGTGAYPTHSYSLPSLYTVCVSVTDSQLCTASYCDTASQMMYLNVVQQLPSGISTISLSSVAISYYSHAIHLSVSIEIPSSVRLYDESGRLIMAENNFTGDVWPMGPGISERVYIFQLRNDNGSLMQKVIIK